ncbi:MAG: hypothetical protein JW876_02495 [Candidatus Krumholzibacteriota bacterium]|nr:hypothetical protein [Candidatus Krumholzibacteriota bacterium]
MRLHRFAALVIVLACAPPTANASGDNAFVTTTDYTTGSASIVHCDTLHTTDLDVASVHSDAISVRHGNLVYVVNRGGADNVQVIDPENDWRTVRQFSVGNGLNPQDIAFFTATKAYVARYETNDLLVVDPADGSWLGTIDLSMFADADGLCEMNRLCIVGERLFVTIQRIDRNNWWMPVGDSYVAVVDCAADTLLDTDSGEPGIQPIALAAANPFSDIELDPVTNRILVSCVGTWGIADGGVEIVNPWTLESEGFLVTESAAGGDINDVEIYSPTIGYLVVTNASWNTDLVSFDPSTGLATGTIYAPPGYVINDIEISPGGELFLADGTPTRPGIRVYDAATGAPTAGPVSTGLPPFDICFTAPRLTPADTPPAAAALAAVYPNPFNPSTTVRFTLPRAARARVAVCDAAGRLVRTLADRAWTAGAHEIAWNGRTDRGLAAASGVYFVCLRTPWGDDTRRAVLIR